MNLQGNVRIHFQSLAVPAAKYHLGLADTAVEGSKITCGHEFWIGTDAFLQFHKIEKEDMHTDVLT